MTDAILLRQDELGSPSFFADPYPAYARLRAAAPVKATVP